MKTIARNTKTGKYFNGTDFSAVYWQQALILSEETTLEQLQLVWGNTVELVQIP